VKGRKSIPSEIQTQLLIQCGYKCSVPMCNTTESLEFHHINKKRNDHRKENMIVFCAVHHHQAHTRKISTKACQVMRQMLQKTENVSVTWKPLPNIVFNVSQRLLRTLTLPTVGWEAYNDSPYQLKVRIEVHPILGGRDLFPLSDPDINGTNPYTVEPRMFVFANGCFSLPQECATSKDELILEIRATVKDVNDPQKGEHKLLPRRWKYVRELNGWSYYPQQPIAYARKHQNITNNKIKNRKLNKPTKTLPESASHP